MDNSSGSSAPPPLHSIANSSRNTVNNVSINSSDTNVGQYLKKLNKISHKISKPPTRRNNSSTTTTTAFDNHQQQIQLAPLPPSSRQPHVYNIDMIDFRDVVQKLTGSPAHYRFSSPQPIPPPKQPSSRLQQIRPPPLPAIANRRSPMINNFVLPPHPHLTAGVLLSNFRPPPPTLSSNPISPLPPFPPVYTATESPISAYIRRFLQDSVSTFDSDPNRYPTGLSPLVPLINGPDPPPNESFVPAPAPSPSIFIPPFSPLPFGCLSPVYSPGQLDFPSFLHLESHLDD